MPKVKTSPHTNDEIRQILLEYFHNRNKNARSARSDKTGVASKISVIRKDLKASHSLGQSEIWSNLTYLISQGWVEEVQVAKNVPLKSGTIIPQVTTYYKITAAGIDRIEGQGRFTMPKFHGIKIEATGQNIITLGDGNQVDARYGAVASELAELKRELLNSNQLTEAEKLAVVADIETIQSQLVKKEPEKSVIRTIWSTVEKAATATGLAANAAKLGGLLAPLLRS
jgi:hypothetical protein